MTNATAVAPQSLFTPSEGGEGAGAESTATRRRRVRALVGAAIVVLLVAVALVAPSSSSSAPLDPHSTTADGTKALVLLLRSVGATVQVGGVTPAPGRGVALVLQDRLSSGDRAGLSRWVDGGGRLVLTDPLSPLSGVRADNSSEDAINQPAPGHWPGCPLDAVRDVHALDTPGAGLLVAGAGQVGCFPAGRGDVLVARRQGTGTVVVLGGPEPWINSALAVDDDAELAVGLLAPVPGTEVTIIGSSPVGTGQQSLVGLISPHLIEAFWGLLAAFVILVAWRARRLGRPVADAVPVELPGSGLVAATGNLLQEGAHREAAARLLRADLRRLLADRLGTAADLPPDALAAVVSARTGIPAGRLRDVLQGPPPVDDTALVALAQQIEQTRQEVTRAR